MTLLSQLDRQLPALLVRPLKQEFGISDTAFSLLQGYAFAIFYTLAGSAARSLRRPRQSSQSHLHWTAVLERCNSLVRICPELFASAACTRRRGYRRSRAGASCLFHSSPTTSSPTVARRALAVYYVSIAIGSGASLLFGGWLLATIPSQGLVLGGLGELSSWRIAFLAAAVPGVPLAAVLLWSGPRADAARRHRQSGSSGRSFGCGLHPSPAAPPRHIRPRADLPDACSPSSATAHWPGRRPVRSALRDSSVQIGSHSRHPRGARRRNRYAPERISERLLDQSVVSRRHACASHSWVWCSCRSPRCCGRLHPRRNSPTHCCSSLSSRSAFRNLQRPPPSSQSCRIKCADKRSPRILLLAGLAGHRSGSDVGSARDRFCLQRPGRARSIDCRHGRTCLAGRGMAHRFGLEALRATVSFGVTAGSRRCREWDRRKPGRWGGGTPSSKRSVVQSPVIRSAFCSTSAANSSATALWTH